MNVKLTLSYDGTDFAGWQTQSRGRTVQGVLTDALGRITRRKVKVTGASRTDAGVHARGQTASFRLEKNGWRPDALRDALNGVLPADVRVSGAAEADEGFNARFSAAAKEYRYRLLWEDDPLSKRYGWELREQPDEELLHRCAEALTGRRDMRPLSAGKYDRGDVDIRGARWEPSETGATFVVLGDRFLYRLVRSVVGLSVRIARGREPFTTLERALAGERPTLHLAPAKGLCLERVLYEQEEK